MGIIVNKETEKRSELTDRVSTSLQERARQTGSEAKTDFTEGSEYRKKTGRFAWVWFVLIFLAVLSLIYIFVLPG